MDLSEFFPKYPNIHKDTDDQMFNLYPNEDFRDVIVSKKEFRDLKLPNVEQVPENPGEYFNHQKIISRFLASATPYDQLLLAHEMGTGKTCTAIACIEKVRHDSEKSFKGALVFARGDGLLKNFVDELLFKCTDGRYIPENYQSLSDMKRARRVGKLVGEYYTLATFEKFAKQLRGLDDARVKSKYSNHIIVIDEVHNIRLKGDKTEEQLDIYNQFHRFLHLVDNCKVILMSGTPIKDNTSEIANVMNLILPLTNQFDPDTFVQEYFDKDGDGSSFKPEKTREFIQKISGRVSFLKSMTSDVKKVFMGERMGNLKHFKVWPTKMSRFQSDVYSDAYARDKKDKTISSYSRQASLFVFPDGTYGTEGSEKYISRRTVTSLKGTKKTTYVLSKELSQEIGRDVNRLRRFSCKYADLIENILTTNAKTFIYCEFVDGSGAILLGLILQHFGYSPFTGKETTKALRYAIVTNKTSSPREIKKTIDRYNMPANRDGEIVSVIIGSKVIAEGYTLKSVSREVILTPHWNYSETAQAIARGWRVGSHSQSPNIKELKIYQTVSFPDTDTPSKDLEMYELSEKKDMQIKEVEYAIKRSAFDCWLNKDRNMIPGYDGMRECDYRQCDYKCVGQPPADVDVTTYNLYYSLQVQLIEHLTNFFKENYSITLPELMKKFPEYTMFEVVKTLRELVEKDITAIDRYHMPQYIRMDKTTVFLSPDPSRFPDYLTSFYSRNLIVDTNIEYDDIVAEKMREDAPNKVKNIFKYPEYVNTIIPSLEQSVQLVLLQGCIEAEDKKSSKNLGARAAVLAYFRGSYREDSDRWVLTTTNPQLCLIKGANEWQDCIKIPVRQQQKSPGEEEDEDEISRLFASPIGYYGMYNPRLDNVFCLREVQSGIKDLRKVKVGKRCVNFSKQKLTDIIARRIKKPPPEEFFQDMPRSALEAIAANMGSVTIPEDFEGSDDDLRRVIFWGRQLMEKTCANIREWMADNNLVQENLNCGQQKKRRIIAV